MTPNQRNSGMGQLFTGWGRVRFPQAERGRGGPG